MRKMQTNRDQLMVEWNRTRRKRKNEHDDENWLVFVRIDDLSHSGSHRFKVALVDVDLESREGGAKVADLVLGEGPGPSSFGLISLSREISKEVLLV